MTDYRLWPSTNSNGTVNGGFTHDLGVQFKVNQDNVTFNGFYFYAGSGTFDTAHANYSFRLYSTTNGTSGSLISGTTVNLAADLTKGAWNYQAITTPVALTNGATYVAVLHYSGTANSYTSTTNYWSSGPGASGITAGPITAPGTSTALAGKQCAYNEPSATAAFPTSSLGSNYWIDVSVTLTPPSTNANAGVASASAVVGSTSTTLVLNAGAGNGSVAAAAYGPTVAIGMQAGRAQVACAVQTATVSTAPYTGANAGIANASASAHVTRMNYAAAGAAAVGAIASGAVAGLAVQTGRVQASVVTGGISAGIGVRSGVATAIAVTQAAVAGNGATPGCAEASVYVASIGKIFYPSTRIIKIGLESRQYRIPAESRILKARKGVSR